MGSWDPRGCKRLLSGNFQFPSLKIMVIHTPALHWIPGTALLLCQAQGRLALCSIKALQEKKPISSSFSRFKAFCGVLMKTRSSSPFQITTQAPMAGLAMENLSFFPAGKREWSKGMGKERSWSKRPQKSRAISQT